jgi:hypothetical protein
MIGRTTPLGQKRHFGVLSNNSSVKNLSLRIKKNFENQNQLRERKQKKKDSLQQDNPLLS